MKWKLTLSQLEILLGLLATAWIVLSIPLYAFLETPRLETAQAAQLSADLNEAMSLYAENCSVCHGLAGEGIGATPPLNNPALRSADPVVLTKTIARGVTGTAMPAWNLEDGGSLSDYQISQMVDLIVAGNWAETQNRVINLGLAPKVPFVSQPNPEILAQLQTLPDGEVLAAGVTLFAGQCVACHGADGLGSALAPALNDPAVRAKTVEELERTIRLGVPGTLMASWEKALTGEQIASALALITRWAEIPAGAIPASDHPLPVTEESLALGAQLFSTSCANCHGPAGQGTQRAPALNVRSFLTSTSDLAIQQIVTLGVAGTAMPAWGDRLTDAEIQAIVGFVRTWEPAAPEVAVPTRVQGPWRSAATANQNLTAAAWLQSLDWRSALLILVVAAFGGALTLLAVTRLKRLERNISQP